MEAIKVCINMVTLLDIDRKMLQLKKSNRVMPKFRAHPGTFISGLRPSLVEYNEECNGGFWVALC